MKKIYFRPPTTVATDSQQTTVPINTYEEYLLSCTWHSIRDEAIARDFGRCRICDSPFNLHVHHRKYPKIYGQEPLSDLITLCKNCHDLFHGMSCLVQTKGKTSKQIASEQRHEKRKKIKQERVAAIQERAKIRAHNKLVVLERSV